jgi:hypothetical protein
VKGDVLNRQRALKVREVSSAVPRWAWFAGIAILLNGGFSGADRKIGATGLIQAVDGETGLPRLIQTADQEIGVPRGKASHWSTSPRIAPDARGRFYDGDEANTKRLGFVLPNIDTLSAGE